MFAYVDEWVPHFLTPVGFLKMQKDQKGYYIFATKEELNPENNNLTTFIGAMTGGIIGGIVGGIIDANTRKKQVRRTRWLL